MIDITDLDEKEKLVLLRLLIDDMGWPKKCFQCNQMVFVTITCDSYNRYVEECCKLCSVYCEPCNRYYCEQGDYHHERCKYEADKAVEDV